LIFFRQKFSDTKEGKGQKAHKKVNDGFSELISGIFSNKSKVGARSKSSINPKTTGKSAVSFLIRKIILTTSERCHSFYNIDGQHNGY
jgi:hypothetical protein